MDLVNIGTSVIRRTSVSHSNDILSKITCIHTSDVVSAFLRKGLACSTLYDEMIFF